MTRAIPDPIQWHEGLLLTPQHFQQLALRLESLIQALPGHYTPFHWGVRRFDYDATDFTIGVLTVRALDAVMPDGFHVTASPDHDQLQLDLRPLAPSLRQKPMPVYLALPLVEGASPAAVHRFSSYESDPVADENTGDGAIVMPRLRPRLSLIAANEPPSSRYTSFPLIEARCEGETYLPTEFVPPLLQVGSASALGRKAGQISEVLRRKAAQLAERAILAPQSAAGAETRSQLRALVSSLPPLEALLRSEGAHPFALYVALSRVAGDVAVLGDSLLPPVFAPYQHNDARRSFDDVTRFILQAVDDGVPESVRRFAFTEEGEAFRLEADPAWTAGFTPGSRLRLVLALRSDAGDAQALEWGENSVIGSRSAIPSLLARRVLGIPRAYAERVGEIMPPRGLYLFELAPAPGETEPGEDLLVFGSTRGIRPEGLFLYVFEPQAETEGV